MKLFSLSGTLSAVSSVSQECIIENTYIYNLLDELNNQHKSILGTSWVQTIRIIYQKNSAPSRQDHKESNFSIMNIHELYNC